MSIRRQSSWREERMTIPQDIVYEHRFADTEPNYIVITNGAGGNVYVCTSPAVSVNTFDMIIPPFGRRMYARDLPLSKVYLFTEVPNGANLHITSFVAPFNPSDIVQTQEITGTTATGLLGTIEINEIKQALPAGANIIGQVGISSFGASLPAGNDKIGAVDVASLPELPAGTKKIGSVDALLDLNEDIEVMPSLERVATGEAPFVNKNFRGAKIVVDVTAITGAASIVVKIQGKDSKSGKTFDILTSAAIAAQGTYILTIHPGVSEVANEKTSDILPRNVNINVTHANADDITYSVSALMVM